MFAVKVEPSKQGSTGIPALVCMLEGALKWCHNHLEMKMLVFSPAALCGFYDETNVYCLIVRLLGEKPPASDGDTCP